MSIIQNRISGFTGNAGGGGGGLTSVSTDNLTILGNGQVANPIYATGGTFAKMDIALTGGTYSITKQGLYRVLYGGSNAILLDYVPNDSGQRVTIINQGNTQANIQSSIYQFLYQGTFEQVTSIPIGATFEFVYIQSESVWICYNTQSAFSPNTIDLNTYGADYPISVAGNYGFSNNSSGYTIIIPDPQYYEGLKLVLINYDTNHIFYSGFTPRRANGTAITRLSLQTSQVLQCCVGVWRQIR